MSYNKTQKDNSMKSGKDYMNKMTSLTKRKNYRKRIPPTEAC